MTLFTYRLGPLLRRTGSEIWDDDVPELAASAAYTFFLAIFPLLLFLAPILALTGNKEETMYKLLDSFGRSLPPAAFDLFRRMLMDVVFATGAPGLMSVGVIGALWAGSNIFTTLIGALNVAFDATETRPWWKRAGSPRSSQPSAQVWSFSQPPSFWWEASNSPSSWASARGR